MGLPRMSSPAERQDCLKRYVLLGWSGYFPHSCRQKIIWLPEEKLGLLWGWPDTFMSRMHENGSAILLKDLSTPEELQHKRRWPVDGAKTRRIESMGASRSRAGSRGLSRASVVR